MDYTVIRYNQDEKLIIVQDSDAQLVKKDNERIPVKVISLRGAYIIQPNAFSVTSIKDSEAVSLLHEAETGGFFRTSYEKLKLAK